MRKIYLSLICLILCGLTFAQSVTREEAAMAAQRFLESQGKTLVNCAKTVGDAQQPLLYIFNAENAFVVVSGDKNAQPVLAYIDHQLYNDADVIAPFEMWINHYANQIEQIRRQNIVQNQYIDQWQKILSNAPAFRTGNEVDPLMLSKWDQGEYYNFYCPRDLNGQNGRVVTGCVATAMAQLIYYYRFPETGTGSYSYTDENYGVQSADYGNTTYNFNAMCDEPTCINTEISKLIYHCGVGVDMVYGPTGSGMYNHSAARVLRTYFKFSPETEYLYRDSTDLNWDSVIVSHLERRMPLYYAGWSVPNINGHGFICDGYKTVDSSYYFHFNFGWSGYMDGYFYTNSLYVGSSNFNLAQELIVNAYPDTTQYTYPTPQPLAGSMTLTAREGTFTDGSQTYEHCPAGKNFIWNIVPDPENLVDLSLTIHYSLAYGDTLYVSSPYVNTFEMRTADTGTMTIAWGTHDLTVFLLTHSSESEGFRAHYTANYETFCSGTKMFTTPTGTITDGSEDTNYNNFSNCKFRIMLSSAYSATAFHINALDLEEGRDFLRFYNNTVTEAHLMLTLTGHLSDTNFVLDTRRLTLVFETDEANTGAGFDIDYAGGTVSVDDHTPNELQVYPNPAADHVTVTYATPIHHVEILNMEGQTIYFESPDSEQFMIPTANWPAGIYLLSASTSGQIVTRKIVKY